MSIGVGTHFLVGGPWKTYPHSRSTHTCSYPSYRLSFSPYLIGSGFPFFFFDGGSGKKSNSDRWRWDPDDIRLVSCSQLVPRGRQRKKSRTPRGEISWNQVEIMRNQSRFPWNQARKSAQPSSPTHFYNVWRHFWGKSRGNQREIRKSRTPKLLVADPSELSQLAGKQL